MRWSSHLPRFRLQIDVPRAIPQNSEQLRMKSDHEKGGTTGVHVIAFLHPPAVAPVVASVVSKFTLCAHLASSPDWRPKRQCAAPGKAPIEPGTGCTSVVHLSVRLLYGVPGEAMSNIHVNNIQHSKITINCGLHRSWVNSGNSRSIANFCHELASSHPGDWTAATRIRARRVLGTALSSDTPTRDVRPPDFCGAPSGLTCL